MKFKILVLAFLVLATGFFNACQYDCACDDLLSKIDYPAAFVVNGGDGNLSVINLNRLTVTDEISLNGAAYPRHIYLSPDKKMLAVAITSTDLSAGHHNHTGNIGTYKVQILDAGSGEILREMETEFLPHNAVFNASGTELWISQSNYEGEVLVYDVPGFTQKTSIAVGESPAEVTFSADGSKAFVANTADATVTMIDAATKAVLQSIPVGQVPVAAWPGADGNMYVPNESSQTLSVISVATGAVTATISLGFKPGYAAYQPQQEELWVSDATKGRVAYYQLENGTWDLKGNLASGKDAYAIVFSADNKTAFVTNRGAGTVSVIDVESHTKTSEIAVGSKPNGMVLKQ